MPYLFRPTYTAKTPDGCRTAKKAKAWYGEYTDGDGTKRRVKLSANKSAAQQMLNELVRRSEMERAGVRDPYRDHRAAPLAGLLAEYRQASAARGNTAAQALHASARCERVFEACGFAVLNDLDAESAASWLAGRRQIARKEGGFGPQTSNHYTSALKAFGNWLVRARKAAENPFRHMTKVNVEADIRHRRRPLSADEFGRLTATARGGRAYRKLSGPDRAMLYTVAGMTGLRAAELASLTPGSFALDADPPTVTVEAGYSKHRRRDVVPLHPELVAAVRPWLIGKPVGEPVWPGRWAANTDAGELIRHDLATARTAWLAEAADPGERTAREASDFLRYKDSAGQIADFHSLRHRFVTELVRAGVNPKEAKELARHSTITLTMDRYSHVGLKDTAAAVAKLPGVPGGGPSACSPACSELAVSPVPTRPQASPSVPNPVGPAAVVSNGEPLESQRNGSISSETADDGFFLPGLPLDALSGPIDRPGPPAPIEDRPLDHKFQINLRGVIDLLSEHLYSGPDVYVRELLQNAVDAITARTAADPAHRGEVLIECHSPKGKPPSLAVTDNGVGLTSDEVHKFLSTIGLSSKKGTHAKRPADFIGQFGIGILSCFVVSEEIVVITRSATEPDAKPVEWRAKADGTYSLKELDRDLEPGTQVWLTAKAGVEQLFAFDEVKRLARSFGGLLPYPVKVTAGRVSETVNDGGAPWRDTFSSEKERSRTLLAYGREVFGTDFLDAVPLRSAAGQLDGVAFVLPFTPAASGKRPHRVYLKNMFLSEAAENLLPDWAFFVQVVVNANDLRPTASRESFYEDTKLSKARQAIGDALRAYLVDLAERRPEKLERFLSVHHRAIKALAVEDDEFYRLVIDWLPFETSLGQMRFGEFRQKTDRVRYVADVDSFRQIARVAAAQGVPVVNAGYVYDAELVAKAPDAFPGLTVEAVDPAAVAREFDELSLDEQDAADEFLRAADAALRPFRCRAEAKRFRPAELPALYSTTAEGRFFRTLEQSKEVANPLWGGVLNSLSKREQAVQPAAVLCFNFDNPLVRTLAAGTADPAKWGRAVQMLYVQSLLLGHHPLSAKEMAVLNDGLLALIADAVS